MLKVNHKHDGQLMQQEYYKVCSSKMQAVWMIVIRRYPVKSSTLTSRLIRGGFGRRRGPKYLALQVEVSIPMQVRVRIYAHGNFTFFDVDPSLAHIST